MRMDIPEFYPKFYDENTVDWSFKVDEEEEEEEVDQHQQQELSSGGTVLYYYYLVTVYLVYCQFKSTLIEL